MAMIILKKIFLFIILLSISSATKYKSFSKEWNLERKVGLVMEDPITLGRENEFIYGTCLDNPSKELNCTIIREHFNINGSVSKNSCHIEYSSKNGKKSAFFVRSSRGNKILLLFIDAYQKRSQPNRYEADLVHRLIDMTTCLGTETKIYMNQIFDQTSDDMFLFNIAIHPRIIQYDDYSYDLFYYDKDNCNGARCKYHVDENGNLDDIPIPYLPKEYTKNKIIIYSIGEKDNSYAVVTHNPNFDPRGFITNNKELRIFRVNQDDYEEILHLDNHTRPYAVDDSNGKFSYCWADMKQVHCNQYDEDYNLNIDDEIIDLPFEVKSLRIKNQEDGNFLLLTEEQQKRRYFFRNITPEGQFGNTIKIDFDESKYSDDSPIDDTETIITIDDDENVCLSIVDRNYSVRKDHWKLSRKCFLMDNFSKNGVD